MSDQHPFYYKIWSLIVLLFFSNSWGESFYSLTEKGEKAYREQLFDSAVSFLEKAKIKSPERDDISFNLAHAYYKNKQYTQAESLYQEGLKYGDTSLHSLYHYNLGNSFYKQAEQALLKTEQNQQQSIQEAIKHYTQSLDSYRKSYAIDSTSISTNKNLKLSYQHLKKLKEFQKKQEKDNQNQKETPPSKHAKSIFKKVMDFINQKKYIKAEIILEDLIIKDPTAQKYKPNLKRISKINQIVQQTSQ